jgi:hypothetical protein
MNLLTAQDHTVGDQPVRGIRVKGAVLHHSDGGNDDQGSLNVKLRSAASEKIGQRQEEKAISGDDDQVADDNGEEVWKDAAQGDRRGSQERGYII